MNKIIITWLDGSKEEFEAETIAVNTDAEKIYLYYEDGLLIIPFTSFRSVFECK